jgi:hypothetical protein
MDEATLQAELNRVSRELKTIRELMSKVIFYITDAESEIPERMRRFMNYMHDVHDIKYMYEEQGHDVPQHVLRELERLDDRYRQVLSEMTASGGAFDKVRREMAADPMNRWDHTRLLTPPTHKPQEQSCNKAEQVETAEKAPNGSLGLT